MAARAVDVQGGLKIYNGSPAAARHYLEADRSRADDYYLVEGTGLAERLLAAGPCAGEAAAVAAAGWMDGDTYQRWVAGHDVETGALRDRQRENPNVVRFVEVVVNGPKSWSLAAAVHPEIAAAYDQAQGRAAREIVAWLAVHATTRVGPRGRQVQVPLERFEAAVIRHYTSRAGDPHRHLHLQINNRVWAQDAWRALHTVGVRDSLQAINGIGHAAMMCDPDFRHALAAHGYHLDPDSEDGELLELKAFVGPFSARSAQIARNIDRYEAQWRHEHPGDEPGPKLRQLWARRGWAEARPDKVIPADGEQIRRGWVSDLTDLGFTPPPRPLEPATTRATRSRPSPVGSPDRSPDCSPDRSPTTGGATTGLIGGDGWLPLLDDLPARERLSERVLARLAARRSAWNTADIRGEVERLVGAAGTPMSPEQRNALAEDLTSSLTDACIPLLERPDAPEHVRNLTSPEVLEVEDYLTRRLAALATGPPKRITQTPDDQLTARLMLVQSQAAASTAAQGIGDGTNEVSNHHSHVDSGSDRGSDRDSDRDADRDANRDANRLDPTQQRVADAIAGRDWLVVVEGAAGAGKTTVLAAARSQLAQLPGGGRSLVVVTPTRKAAQVASRHLGTTAESGEWLAHQHGFRWDDDGRWSRDPEFNLEFDLAPAARLAPGDVLLIDEAGMLKQDTAKALLTIAAENRCRVVLMGDRHQLPAVGRGGVLDLAARTAASAHPDSVLTLDRVHRFTNPVYAYLSLRMRSGNDAAAVFDQLFDGGHIEIHATDVERVHAIARQAAASASAATSAVNRTPPLVIAETRAQVAALNATIRDARVKAGLVDDQRPLITGAGERLGPGDRITTRRNDRTLDVTNRENWIIDTLTADGSLEIHNDTGRRVLPSDYAARHVHLAYATTVYGAQGDTVQSAHLLINETTTGAAAYVGMTRGRHHNTAHLVADTIDEARDQWVRTLSNDRADLGPAAAREAAAEAIDRYGIQLFLGSPSAPQIHRTERTGPSIGR